MIARGKGGKIVHIGSLTSLLGLPYLAVYAMTKSALGRTDAGHGGGVGAIRHSGELHRARVHSHRPESHDVAAAGNDGMAERRAANPRLGTPQDIAGLVGVFERPGFRLTSPGR